MRKVLFGIMAIGMLLTGLPVLAQESFAPAGPVVELVNSYEYEAAGYRLDFPAAWEAVAYGYGLSYLRDDEYSLRIAFFTPQQVSAWPIPIEDLRAAVESVAVSIGVSAFEADTARLYTFEGHDLLSYSYEAQAVDGQLRPVELLAVCLDDDTFALGFITPLVHEDIAPEMRALAVRILGSLRSIEME